MATVSQIRAAGEKYLGADAAPEGLASYWSARAGRALTARPHELAEVGIDTPVAAYRELSFASTDGQEVRARVLLPKAEGPHPLILVFHDMDRGVRGWHHLTRYLAPGYAVCHLECRPWAKDVTAGWQDGADGLVLAQLVDDALAMAGIARTLEGVDASRIVTWGEGLGGLLSLACAALVPGVAKCAAFNPTPADFRGSWEAGASDLAFSGVTRHFREEDPAAGRLDEFFGALRYVDAASFAALLPAGAELLCGCGLMDAAQPPLGCYAAYNRAACAKKELATYPKFVHERINDFEDRLLAFMHFGER
ncbi:MAG: acetylxylan esterase [Paratractidigestivibacter faecalis]|uniref:acetylxylan esterase n=1 Tax=Paratractidigestivibacter faecalis TaxID=2292441 RepID=UPI0026F03ED7|nr:acetylxylan esterase [Paratractidigestivibacter faecalis]MCI6507051.1 acetylxylan esterase [Olsenella sp.]MDD6417257.1 acetylxylan esterase [Paratractidigestivibacter faecalis]MDY6013966.1 acetylxylan esterase [Paratractidigestivibacter faecalis]